MRGRVRLGLLLAGLAIAGLATAAVFTVGGAEDEQPPLAAFERAVQRTSGASYTYVGDVRVTTAAGPTTLRIDGRVGRDLREVRVRTSDGATTTFRLQDGVATIDRGDGPEPAPAGSSLDETSLELLRSVDRLVQVNETRYEGTLRGDLLLQPLSSSAVIERDSEAFVTIDLDPVAGVLRGYTVTELSGTWRIDIRFADVRPAAV
ncbi:MAG: hypothetical protein KY469_18265 [Actinobacteria bacterium]|nr:hypothetical protein [Actinomycetota bacterium]